MVWGAVIIEQEPCEIQLSSEGRSPKLHVGEVIRHLALEMGYLDKKYEDAEMDVPTVALGLAWEDWYCQQRPYQILYHPGEYEQDGLILTPDGISFDDDDELRVEEFKSTKKGAPRSTDELGDKKFWLWMTQIKAYCHAIGTTRARLHAIFLNGRYEWYAGGNTLPMVFRIQFEQHEIVSNWTMLQIHARDYFGERL